MKKIKITKALISDISLFIKVSRPILWWILPVVFLLGFFQSGAAFSFMASLQMLTLVYPMSFIGYGVNDVYDYESDKNNKRKGGVEGLILRPKDHKKVLKFAIYMGGVLMLSSILTLNLLNIVCMIVLVSIGYFYSSPPLRLKEIPIIDSVSNGFIYFLLPYLLGFTFGDLGTLENYWQKAIYVALAVSGIHAFSAIADYTPDKKNRITTIATVFGKRITAFFSIITLIITLLFGNFSTPIINLYLLICISLTLLITIVPRERIAGIFSKIIYIGFLITITIYLADFLIN